MIFLRSACKLLLSAVLLSTLVAAPSAAVAEAQEKHQEDSPREVRASPKSPWGEFTIVQEHSHPDPWYVQVLLWVPNRIMDFIDIFRVDVGMGPTYGGVVRITKYVQIGYRSPNPASIRIGDFGRRAPVLVERSKEYGIGPGFVSSKERKICPGEVGLGADLGVGLYAGVCVDEALDFVAGLFFLDLLGDDIR